MSYGGALLLVGVLALAGCSGEDGAAGPAGANGTNGTDGTNGTNGTNGINGVAGKLSLTIDGVATSAGTSTLTFTVYPAAAVCPGGTCNDTLSNLGQKTFYATEYDAASNTFTTAKSFSFSGFKFKGITADGNGAQYTATKASAPFAPEASTTAFVYGYVATPAAVPAPTSGHYMLPSSVANAAKVYGAVGYNSTANVSGCESCHGTPFSKHGYRQAAVAGLNEFVSCKVCHTDQRPGNDQAWYLTADDPATLAANPTLTAELKAKYAYTANIMNDVHNSHAFEFNYPQSMANCTTCHAGKLDRILTDANFKPTVCKSCHPVTGVASDPLTGRAEPGRAPSMAFIWTSKNVASFHTMDLYTATGADTCNGCHKAGGGGKTFAELHAGYNEQIFADANGTRYSASIKAQVVSASFDASTNLATVNFSVTGAATNAIIRPTVVASLYGYDTKDFVISGHSSQFVDKTPNLEWTEGATVRGSNPPVSANTSRLTVSPETATQGNASWVVTIDLTTWASMISSGQVKRIEVAFLPALGLDQTQIVSTTNKAIAIAGVTQTIDVSTTATDAGIAATDSKGEPVWYKRIVDPSKCNACHVALGTTFHTPAYGSAGTVACRLCHFVGAAASHLEMQSRSIDSYVHAIHRMQKLDAKNVNLTDPVQALHYEEHVEGNYPNFAGPLNCESCHNGAKSVTANGTTTKYPATYNVPDQTRSLPSIVSASATVVGRTGIGTFAAEITGPGARACGSCHRAEAINQGDGVKLAAFVAHTNLYSSNVTATDSATFLNTAAYIESVLGGPAAPAVAGAAVEQCTICHPTAGSDHQDLFNIWKNGL